MLVKWAPGYHHTWYWPCMINRSESSIIEEWFQPNVSHPSSEMMGNEDHVVWSSLLSHFWLSTIYDEIYIQYISKSHMHSMTLRNSCRHGNDSIAAGRTGGCDHGRPWCNQQRQSRRHDDPRSSVDKIHYNISIKPLKHECICHNIKFYIV